ncbi:hypothetical protein PTTG_28172 [Puccinia triticina 1-1 BBBD Race 1]|uniref:CCHC-type domain-containing protein n=1 Tax=Puccinia triticina (isolate 1-1 / race 1 (BBBD)) TaxID=630390 RepID=A0A180GEA6_PUCT1|nr:hypothetical protein PTTG_28172 [Puccinia triticina 1-1 BBBD Race 1]
MIAEYYCLGCVIVVHVCSPAAVQPCLFRSDLNTQSGIRDPQSVHSSPRVNFPALMDSNANYKKVFELQVKQLVQDDKRGRCPSFESIMLALTICKDQHKHATELEADPSPSFTSPSPPTALATLTSNTTDFDVSAFLAEVPKDEWVDALDFYAVTAHKCWQCGGENHYAKNCPDRPATGQAGKGNGRAIGTIVGTIYGHLLSGTAMASSRFPWTNF